VLRFLTCPGCLRRSGINIYKERGHSKYSFNWGKFEPLKQFKCEKCDHIFDACVYAASRCRKCKLRLDCLTHNVTAHVSEWFEFETRFMDPAVKCITNGGPNNFTQPPVHVMQAWLLKANNESVFTSICPKCGGILPVRRDPNTLEFLETDRCLKCAQQYVYMDTDEMRRKYG
jgi:hypothetical protein